MSKHSVKEYEPKPIEEMRAILNDPTRECDDGCKGRDVFTSDDGRQPHVERCDQCVGDKHPQPT